MGELIFIAVNLGINNLDFIDFRPGENTVKIGGMRSKYAFQRISGFFTGDALRRITGG